MMMVLNILLIAKKMRLLNRSVLSYLKWVAASNILKTVEKYVLHD